MFKVSQKVDLRESIMTKERIQKVLSRAGVASRREVERMIRQGRITVNGKVILELGFALDAANDVVFIDEKPILAKLDEKPEMIYYLFNKPAGFVSTTKDEKDRPCVLDLIKSRQGMRIYPVGRLDYDAEGALLLTNDGELTNKLLQPKSHVKKTYMVKVKGTPLEGDLDKLRRGIYLAAGPTGPSEIKITGKAKINTWLQVILIKGQNNQIKEMFWRIKHPVGKIIRVNFAGISTEGLPVGKYRSLSKVELVHLKNCVGLT